MHVATWEGAIAPGQGRRPECAAVESSALTGSIVANGGGACIETPSDLGFRRAEPLNSRGPKRRWYRGARG